MGWEPIEGGGQRHLVTTCDSCPFSAADGNGDPMCCISWVEPQDGIAAPVECPLHTGPIVVELDESGPNDIDIDIRGV